MINISWWNWFRFSFSQYNLTVFLQIFAILGFSSKGKKGTKFSNLIPYLYQHSMKTVVMFYTCNFYFADIKQLWAFRKLIIFLYLINNFTVIAFIWRPSYKWKKKKISVGVKFSHVSFTQSWCFRMSWLAWFLLYLKT